MYSAIFIINRMQLPFACSRIPNAVAIKGTLCSGEAEENNFAAGKGPQTDAEAREKDTRLLISKLERQYVQC